MGEIFELSIRKCLHESTEMDIYIHIYIYLLEEIIVNLRIGIDRPLRASIVSTHPHVKKSNVFARVCVSV